MGFQTGSAPLLVSYAKPIVGVCDVAMAPMILANGHPPEPARQSVNAAAPHVSTFTSQLADGRKVR